MSDDYLWERSGKPDPEIEKLENLLGRYAFDRPAPEFPERARRRPWGKLAWLVPSLAAAAVAAAVVGVWLGRRLSTRVPPPAPSAGWSVARLEGSPEINGRSIGDAARLNVGQLLETNSNARALVNVTSIGEVQVEPNSRLRLLAARAGEHRLALDRGVIHAMIWAPPGDFQVDTPSAVAVDLGCAYTLSVDERGAGVIRVTFGWVGFKLHDRESFIPEGAVCATRPGIGPGTPYFEDSSKRFSTALERLDFSAPSPAERAAALHAVIAEARRRDALTLWHLVSRVAGSDRIAVYRRLAGFVPLPAGVTEKGILNGNQQMLDRWWDELGYGEMTWWRKWERQWPRQPR